MNRTKSSVEEKRAAMSERREFAGFWFPRDLLFRNGLSLTEKVILLDVVAHGYGYAARNEYFEALLGVGEATVTRGIMRLAAEGLITVTGKGCQRELTPTELGRTLAGEGTPCN